jgi:hypothetical protein
LVIFVSFVVFVLKWGFAQINGWAGRFSIWVPAVAGGIEGIS